jgi:ribonuclease Z
MQLRKYRIRLGKIHHIFISHLHGDHTFGLFGLISTFNLLGREDPLHIFGPDRLEDMILEHLKFFQTNLHYELIFHKIQCRRSSRIFEDANVEVFSLPLIHRVPACGYLFKEKPGEMNIRKEMLERYHIPIKEIVKIKSGEDFITPEGKCISNSELVLPPVKPRTYAYCSDTRPNEKNIPLLNDIDLLFHEATFSEVDQKLAHDTFHTTSTQAASLAVKSNVGKLLLGHFSSRYKKISVLEEEAKAIFKNSAAVNDGDVYHVERLRQSD